MSYVFGIDLGTTYSCIAYIDSYGKPVVLKNSDGDSTTPSVVMFENKDNVVVGMEAKRSVEMEPEKTVQFIKRKIGKENDKVKLNGITYSAPEVSAYILKKLVADANEELRQSGVIQQGEGVKDVVITCPAYFGASEREATKKAGELAGLNVLDIINEPTAAAISYGVSGSEKDETVLIYDLGGGTFDITVMNIKGSDFSVVCTGGDDQLGGKDWDEALMDYVMERYEEECGEDLSEDPETVASLYVQVETWKKSLTARESVKISVNGPGGRFREELTRADYEELTSRLLDRTKNLLDDILKTSATQGYPISKINKVLLVGGSSMMPQVAAMIERDYHITPFLQDPNQAVAKGAAVFAANRKAFKDFVQQESARTGKSVEALEEENLQSGNLDEKYMRVSGGNGGAVRLNITNVLSKTYGIGCLDSNRKLVISNMLMINNKLPATRTKSFYTSVDNQVSVNLDVYESRSTDDTMDVEDRVPLTTIVMNFKNQVPEWTEIEVTFTLDNSGIVHVFAEEKKFGTKLDTTFTLSNQMSDKELRLAGERLNNATVE